MASSYRIGKPWRGSTLDRRNYITYLQQSTKKGDTIPSEAVGLQDFDFQFLQDGDGKYLTE